MDKRVMKQQRIENILLSLKKCDYLTRSQIQRMHNLKSERNANRFLNGMSEYLGTFRNGMENVYYLNKAGRERIDCEKVRKKVPNVEHYLLRNQLYIAMGQPRTWETEIKIELGNHSLVCDAKFIRADGVHVFVEADVTQPMIKNKSKMDRYRKFKELSDDPFHVLWITEIESRKPKLQSLMDGVHGRVYTLKEIM